MSEASQKYRVLDTLPPFDLDAEYAVLGALFYDNNALYKALSRMSSADFYRGSHRIIFETIAVMQSKGHAIDLLTVSAALEQAHQLDFIGGKATLAMLVDAVPTAANIEYYANIVHDKAILRALSTFGMSLYNRCLGSTEELQTLLTTTEEGLFAITQGHVKKQLSPYSVAVHDAYTQMEEAADQKGTVGLSTGYCDLDAMIPGLEPGKLYYLAARPGMGKSALAMNIMEHIALTTQHAVCCFSREMLNVEIGFRSLCARAEVDSTLAKQGKLTPADFEKLTAAGEVLSRARIYLDDAVQDTIIEIRAKARRAKSEQDIALVVVDYLQLLSAGGRFENKNVEISTLSRHLKLLAIELHVPVLCLSQLSREVEKRTNKRPQLSDLRDSGSIEQDADCVLFIYRPEMYVATPENKGIAEIIIAKQRGGATGMVYLGFKAEFTKFYSLDLIHADPTF